mgnify:CR=1 FL=1
MECIETALGFTPPKLLTSDATEILETIASFSKPDPRFALLFAKLDLQKNPENPAMGVARAFRRLDNYVANTSRKGIADILPGAEDLPLGSGFELGLGLGLGLGFGMPLDVRLSS